MVQQVSASSRSEFPHPTETLGLGWEFFKSNAWITVLFVVGSGGLYSLADWFANQIPDSDNLAMAFALYGVAALVVTVAGLVFELGLWRRALDYWDETHGLAAPRSGSDAIRAAVDGATPRALPYLGWSILLAVVAVVLFAVAAAIAAAVGDGALLVTLLIELAALYLLEFLGAFFVVSVADRPGNPLSRSIHVFNGHFWRIVGAYLLFLIAFLIGAVPFAILVAIFGPGDVALLIAGVGIVVLALVLRGAFTAVRTAMYRSVYPPVPTSNP